MKKLIVIIPMLVVLAVGGTAIASSTNILNTTTNITTPASSPTPVAESKITESVQPQTTPQPQVVSKVGVTKLTIDETLTSVLGDRIVTKFINPLESNAKGVLVTFKYLEKDNTKVDHETTQLIRELAKTGENITNITVWTRSPNGGLQNISRTEFSNMNIQELALLSDTEMLAKAKDHSVDVTLAP